MPETISDAKDAKADFKANIKAADMSEVRVRRRGAATRSTRATTRVRAFVDSLTVAFVGFRARGATRRRTDARA